MIKIVIATSLVLTSLLVWANEGLDTDRYPFLIFHKKPTKSVGELPAKLKQQLARNLQNSETLLEQYNQYYGENQEFCLMNEDELFFESCEALDELFIEINELIDSDQMTMSESFESLTSDMGSGIETDGAPITYNTATGSDPHHQLHMESETTPGRYSALNKLPPPSEREKIFDLERTESDMDFTVEVCELNDKLKGNDFESFESLADTMLPQLERKLVDDSVDLQVRIDIFCILKAYYTRKGMHDELFTFLFLNIPAESVPCE